MTTLNELKWLMEEHDSAMRYRQAREDDSAQCYGDACDLEQDARRDLAEPAINALPALIAIAEAAQRVTGTASVNDQCYFHVISLSNVLSALTNNQTKETEVK